MGPVRSLTGRRRWEAAAVSVGRYPIGVCLGEPVEEFDPRPVRNNIGDAQQQFFVAMIPLERFPYLARLARCRTSQNGDEPWLSRREGSIANWTGVCLK